MCAWLKTASQTTKDSVDLSWIKIAQFNTFHSGKWTRLSGGRSADWLGSRAYQLLINNVNAPIGTSHLQSFKKAQSKETSSNKGTKEVQFKRDQTRLVWGAQWVTITQRVGPGDVNMSGRLNSSRVHLSEQLLSSVTLQSHTHWLRLTFLGHLSVVKVNVPDWEIHLKTQTRFWLNLKGLENKCNKVFTIIDNVQ